MKPNSHFLTVCGLIAAVFCVIGPITVPIGPVPVSLLTLAIYIAACVLGAYQTVVSVLVYLLLGAAGMPVFSGYQGGLAKLAGPTGGYLVGYLFLALILGLAAERSQRKVLPCVAGMLAGTAVLYAFGTAWFMVETQTPLWGALTMCVLPFVPVDLCKMAVALPVGRSIRSALDKAQLLPEQG